MLIREGDATDLLDRYVRFYSSLTWFRMYSFGRMGSERADYIKGFETIKSNYEALYEFDDEKRYRNWKEQLGSKLITDLEVILRLNDLQILT